MNSNPSIKCSVSSCAYHNGQQSACTLNEIKVGCTGTDVADCPSTECASFKGANRGPRCNHWARESKIPGGLMAAGDFPL